VFKKIKHGVVGLLLAALIQTQAFGQVTIPTTFTTSVPVSQLNGNFSTLGSSALNRGGGTITGNITVNSGVTIDGVDVGSVLGGSGTPTFSTVTITGAGSALSVTNNVAVNGTGAAAIDVAGGITAGTGNVAIIGTDGRIPALSSTYFASLDGSNISTPAWALYAYSAGNYTASGSMTWTVDLADVSTNNYVRFGDTLFWTLSLVTTTVGGTVNTQLRVTLPNSYASATTTAGVCSATDNGTAVPAFWGIDAAGTYVYIYKDASTTTNWTLSTNNTAIRCMFVIPL